MANNREWRTLQNKKAAVSYEKSELLWLLWLLWLLLLLLLLSLPGIIFFIVCLPTMCRALFIQNEKSDIIRRIAPTPSNPFSFPVYTQLNTHHHHLPRYFTYYVSIRNASYSAFTFHLHAMGSSPPSSSLFSPWRRVAVLQGEHIYIGALCARSRPGWSPIWPRKYDFVIMLAFQQYTR